jgi:MurNAc alpha-1-phosphate uridylyltransferase
MHSEIKTAMLLAAGYGTRLRPLTDHTPKPLVPVAGRPMVAYALEKLCAHGIGRLVINVSHLKGQLMEHFALQAAAAGSRVFPSVLISEEPEPLETGGGLKRAAALLGHEPVFTLNSDILWTDEGETALSRLARHWDSNRMDFLLLAQSKARAVGHDRGEDHLFIKPENTPGWSAGDAPYIIAGIGIMHPRVLADAPEGKFSVKLLWRRALEQNRLFCLPHHGRWFQTGTPADIQRTEEALLKTEAIGTRGNGDNRD